VIVFGGALAALSVAWLAPATTGPKDTEEVGVVDRPERDPTVFADPRRFQRGFFIEAAIGPAIPIGPTDAVLGVGASIAGRMGYEFWRWFGIGVMAQMAIHPYDDGVLVDELLQQYTYLGEARFAIPVKRFAILLWGGAGFWQVSSNLLQVADVLPDNRRFGIAWEGGLGLDVHTKNPHFSGGLLANFIGAPNQRNAGTVGLSLYLRYTRSPKKKRKGRPASDAAAPLAKTPPRGGPGQM
jgi:hypothetical protein